jgi:hypothetical protein
MMTARMTTMRTRSEGSRATPWTRFKSSRWFRRCQPPVCVLTRVYATVYLRTGAHRSLRAIKHESRVTFIPLWDFFFYWPSRRVGSFVAVYPFLPYTQPFLRLHELPEIIICVIVLANRWPNSCFLRYKRTKRMRKIYSL